MRKVLALLFALLFGAGQGCGMLTPVESSPKQVETLEQRVEKPRKKLTREFYDKIKYEDFSNVDFDSLPKEKIELISKFKENIIDADFKYGIGDLAKFEKEISELSNKYLSGKLAEASASECVAAAMKIVMDKLEYDKTLDDTRKDLKSKGEVDLYFYEGIGHCEHYSILFCEIFKIIKSHNPNCKNIYVTQHVGGNYYSEQKHVWNSIWMVDNDKITMAFVDLSNKKKIEDVEVTNVSLDRIKMVLAQTMLDYKNSFEFLEKEYEHAQSDYLKELIFMKSLIGAQFYDRTKGKEDKNFKVIMDALQDAKGMHMWRGGYATVLENAIGAYISVGEQEKADELIEEFKRRFPREELFGKYSHWRDLRR